MGKLWLILIALFIFQLTGCEFNDSTISSGKIVYSIDYPNNKENAFLYRILPEEMILEFDDGIQKSSIRNANLQNLTWVDCNRMNLSFYFQYAEDAYKVNLSKKGVSEMLNSMRKYTIQVTDEQQNILGFKCFKAIATDSSGDKIDLWFTKEIAIEHSNWYTPFHEIEGVLLAYELNQFGLRMKFKAKNYMQLTELEKSTLTEKPSKGEAITWSEYNNRMTNLFATFE